MHIYPVNGKAFPVRDGLFVFRSTEQSTTDDMNSLRMCDCVQSRQFLVPIWVRSGWWHAILVSCELVLEFG